MLLQHARLYLEKFSSVNKKYHEVKCTSSI